MAINRTEFLKLLDKMAAEIGGGFAKSLVGITSAAQIAKLTAAIEAGNLDRIMHAAGMRAGSWNDITERIRNAFIEGGTFTIASEVPAHFGMVFDISNRSAQKWLRQRSSAFIVGINKDQRDAIQLVLKDGMRLGKNPRNIGLDIVGRMQNVPGRGYSRTGGIIGLTQNQTKTVLKARAELESAHLLDSAKDSNYFTRARRIKRFDPIVQRAIDTGKPLSAKTVSRLTGRYRDSLKQLRGETIGRTEALASLNASSYESMEQVIGEGLAPKTAVKRVWKHGGYSKDERKGHREMSKNEQARGMDEAFVNPYTQQVMLYPGQGVASEVINCRCYVENVVDFVEVEKAEDAPPLPGLKKPKPKPKPKPKAKPKLKKLDPKKSFNYDGTEPKRLGWVNTFRKKGAFDAARLVNINTNITDPKQIKALKKGAHYSHRKRGINMTGRYSYDAYDLSIMRHEWGHFLDDQLGLITRQAKHYLKARLTALKGDNVVGGFRYLSGGSRPVKLLSFDATKLGKLGERVYKKNKTGQQWKAKPFESKDSKLLYTHENIEEGWDAIKFSLADKYTNNEAFSKALGPAIKILNSSDHLLARMYRQAKKMDSKLNPWDELLLVEAINANDLSILFYGNGRLLRAALGETDGVFAALSDLIGAATAEDTLGGWALGFGHGKKYYSKSWRLHSQGTEAFANMTALESSRSNKLVDELIQLFVPRYAKWYDDVLDLLNSQVGG